MGNAGSNEYSFSRAEARGPTNAPGGTFSQSFNPQSCIGLKSTHQPLDGRAYIYGCNDIPRLLDDVALAITDYLRTVDPIDVPGESFQHVTSVQVHWPWLTGPLLLQLCAAVLLGCCIAISARQKRRAGTQVWKDSVFPFLFDGLERREKLDEWDEVDEMHELARGNGTEDCASRMEARARRVRVRLQREGCGEEVDEEGRGG